MTLFSPSDGLIIWMVITLLIWLALLIIYFKIIRKGNNKQLKRLFKLILVFISVFFIAITIIPLLIAIEFANHSG